MRSSIFLEVSKTMNTGNKYRPYFIFHEASFLTGSFQNLVLQIMVWILEQCEDAVVAHTVFVLSTSNVL
jgi:hypothetical protein